MTTRALLVACIVLGMTTTSLPVATASADCGAAQRALAGAVERSPGTLSEDLAQALADAMGACEDSRIGLNPQGAKMRVRSPNDLYCSAGSALGPGAMYITVWTAATGTLAYQTTGLINYERFSNRDEHITARDTTATGFDVQQRGGMTAGTAYFAGVPFAADDSDVDGDCLANGDPCRATGYVAYVHRDIQVWIIGDLTICV